MSAEVIIVIAVMVVLFLFFVFGSCKSGKDDKDERYVGKAKLVYRFPDEDGCFLCEFEKNGKKTIAVYGFEKPELEVGDEVEVVWFGHYYRFPHVMDKEVYEKSEQINAQINAENQTGI